MYTHPFIFRTIVVALALTFSTCSSVEASATQPADEPPAATDVGR